MAIIKYPYRDKHGSFRLVYKEGTQYKEYEDGALAAAPRFLPPERFMWRIRKWMS